MSRGSSPRTAIPLALIALALLGAWLAWRQPGPLAPVEPLAVELPRRDIPATPAGSTEEPASPPREPVSAPATSAAVAVAPRLVVQCVSRATRLPLAGVRVQAWQAGPAVRMIAEDLPTGADGRAACAVPAGVVLVVSAGDPAHHVSTESTTLPALAPGETRTVTLEHDAGERAHLCGLVVARESGAPVADAEVAVDGTPRTRTDAAGRFEIDFAAHMPPWLRVEAHGFGPAIASAVPGHETPASALGIELLRTASLEIALALDTGQTAVRTTLRGVGHELTQEGAFTSTWRAALPPLQYAAEADASGVCRFDALPPGVRLDARVTGAGGVLYQSAEALVLQPGEHRRLAWDLRGAAIVGRVTEADGSPAAGIALWLLRPEPGYRHYVDARRRRDDVVARAASGADGSFRLAPVAPGLWLLAPEPTDDIAGIPQEVAVEPGVPQVVADVRLSRGIYVRGRLVAPDGATGVEGHVSSTGPLRIESPTDREGAFVLGPMAPGEVRLVGWPYNTYLANEPVAVTAPADGVVLIARPGAEVAGRVVDASGQGVQAAITVCGADDGMTITRTQEDGAFRLDGFAAGTCTLFASTADGRAGLLVGVPLQPGTPADGLQVVLGPGARLRVRYEGAGVGNVVFRRDGAPIGGDGIEGGDSLMQVVPAGRVTVEFAFPEREERERRELELASGETREVTFTSPAPR